MPLRIVLAGLGMGQVPVHHFDCIRRSYLVISDKGYQQGNLLDHHQQSVGIQYEYLRLTLPVKNPHVILYQRLKGIVIHYKLPLC